MISRRGLLGGLGALLAAPAIVRVASLMPVSPWIEGASCDLRPGALNFVTEYRMECIRAFEENYALMRHAKEECYRITGIDNLGWAAAER